MPIDKRIESAVKQAVKDADQPKELAAKIVAWLAALNAGQEQVDESDASERHLRLLFEAAEVPEGTAIEDET